MRPLYLVSLEELNTRNVRSFAVEQLRRINASMGIRQAGLLANTASICLTEFLNDPAAVASRSAIPQIAFC